MTMSHEVQRLRVEMFEAALNALSAGVVFTGCDGHVFYMNAAAARQIRAGGALRLFNNRLSLADPAAAKALTSALAGASRGNGNESPQGDTIGIPNRDGAGVLATILPLGGEPERSQARPFAASAAVFLQDPKVTPVCPAEAIARLYGLTGAELRVAVALMPGTPAPAVAVALGIGLQTVKTHLRHIFQKTGTARQAELVALLWRMSAPVGVM